MIDVEKRFALGETLIHDQHVCVKPERDQLYGAFINAIVLLSRLLFSRLKCETPKSIRSRLPHTL